ncbi:hypothetical protein C8J56DRAFT_469362 [Mycena floridula]|nr:hypothetical protein C8J56DRAFT_469362 [Mycena floridula]
MSFNFMPGPLFIYLVAAAFPVADLVWFSEDSSSPAAFTLSMCNIFWMSPQCDDSSLKTAQVNARRVIEAHTSDWSFCSSSGN